MQLFQGHADFATAEQQDACEFLLHLFDKMEKESKKEKSQNPAEFFNFEFEEKIEVDNHVQYKNIKEVIEIFTRRDVSY